MSPIVATGFWSWFAENEKGVAAIVGSSTPSDVRRSAYSALSDAFKATYPDLIVEIGPSDDGTLLVITADGKRDLFPAVIACVAEAPELPNWRIQAFRPRLPNHQGIRIYGVSIAGDDLRLVIYRPVNGKADIDVVIRADDELSSSQLATISFLVLDALFGEWDVETHVADVERWQIPRSEPWPDEALPLGDALEAFDSVIAPHRKPQ